MELIQPAAAPTKHLTMEEAETLASTVITDKGSALDEAIHMLTEIAHGKSYTTFEYMAKLMQMRKMSAPAEVAGVERTTTGDTPTCDSCGLQHNAELECTEVSDEDKRLLLDRAREAQDAFWRAESDLEAVIGRDIDDGRDLSDWSLEDLINEQV